MGEFLVSKFPSRSAAHQASIALDRRRRHGATIYAWAIMCKNSQDLISVLERAEYAGRPATVAAIIGGLAGFAAVPVEAWAGQATDLIEGETQLLDVVSNEIARDNTVLIAEIAPADMGSFEALLQHCGGAVIHSIMQRSPLGLPAH